MKTRLRFTKWTWLIVAPLMIIAIGLGFQNCQKANFGAQTTSSSLNSSSINGDGIYYTNQNNVNINITGAALYADQMRASLVQDMDTAKVPWQPIGGTINVDLSSSYATDGSKDGLKTVYIEVRVSTSDTRQPTTSQVFLDTQVPSLTATGLLLTGLQGQTIKQGDQVELTFTGVDRVPSSGQSSGLDPVAGLRWGVANTGDCSESNLTQKTDWIPYHESFTLSWPTSDPTKAFFVCVYGRDKAGNIGTLLSQPFTEIWRVIAGDNNQGNGGAVLGKSVRFGYPTSVAMDSLGNTYVYDSYVNVIRRIDAVTGTITVIAGNGLLGTIVAGSATTTPLSGTSLYFDSKDRLYFLGSGAIWRLQVPTDLSQPATFVKWFPTGSSAMTIDTSTDTMYLSKYSTSTTTASGTYFYKFSIAAIDAAYPATGSTRPSDSVLQAQYLYAGNGMAIAASASFPSPTPASGALDFPASLVAGDSGEVYYSDSQNGAGYDVGHNQIRVIKSVNGVLQNYLVTSLYAAHQLTFMHYTDAKGVEQKYLLAATDSTGLKKIDLSSNAFPVASNLVTTVDPYPSSAALHPLRVGGVIAQTTQIGSLTHLNRIVFTESNNSRMTVLNADLSLSANYGRAVYDAGDTVATSAMVNNPDGLAQGPNGDIYFTEPLSDIIRKVDANGTISLVAGNPGVASTISGSASGSLKSLTYNGTSFTYGVYHNSLIYDSVGNKLYFNDVYQRTIRAIDPAASTFSTLLTTSAALTSDPNSWYAESMAIMPASVTSNRNLYISRHNHENPNIGVMLQEVTSNGNTVTFAGNGTDGAPTDGAAATSSAIPDSNWGVGFDSKQNYYFTGGSGTFEIVAQTGKIKKLTTAGLQSMQVVEDSASGTTHLFGTSTTMYDISINAAGTVNVSQICLPGTFFNNGTKITLATDGNLLFADTRNDRIIKYFIRSQTAPYPLQILSSSCQ